MQSPYLYQYIAASNPEKAAALCANYGMHCNDVNDIANAFYEITTNDGEAGLAKVMALHPDKELFLEFNTVQTNPCNKCPILNKIKDYGFYNATGDGTNALPAAQSQNTNSHNSLLSFSSIENNKITVLAICATAIVITIAITQNKK